MKALSIKQPWAWAILAAGKDVENRTWRTTYRGPLAIHASSRPANSVRTMIEQRYGLVIPADVPTGGIVGTVVLVDCVQNHPSEWAMAGQWHWVLRNPKPLPFAPLKGRLGVFDVDLSEHYHHDHRHALQRSTP